MNPTKVYWPSWPQYGSDEQHAVSRVIESNQLFADVEVRKFEDQYKKYIGCKHVLGLGNATEGLHLALASLNIGVGDEVIVTPYSWISSASCILMQNAVPVFSDIEADTYGLCPEALEQNITPHTKAIIVVHMFGYPCRIKEVCEIAAKHGIPVIEDASHAHGAKIDNQFLGTFGAASVFSLHQRKSLSVGDGGILCTDSDEIAEKVYRLRSFGHPELSYNYRMTEFAGALGQVGLKKLDKQNAKRSQNAEYLAERLSDHQYLKVKLGKKNERAVYHAVLIEVIDQHPELDSAIDALQNEGIPIRKTWSPLHEHPHFNSEHEPARGFPWKHPNYIGELTSVSYKDLEFPVVKKLCPNNLLELYVHPPVGKKEIDWLVSFLNTKLG
jgi:perosamine synthetase